MTQGALGCDADADEEKGEGKEDGKEVVDAIR